MVEGGAAGDAPGKDEFSWISFFSDAGIPPSHAQSYAEVFEDNRIRKDMLSDLTKDILQEMGIAVMGDVLAVMRQARIILHREKRASRSMGKVRGMNFAKAVQGHLQARELDDQVAMEAQAAKEKALAEATKAKAERASQRMAQKRKTAPQTATVPKAVPSAPVQQAPPAEQAPPVDTVRISLADQRAAQADDGEDGGKKRPRHIPKGWEGSYVVRMPKGTTARSKEILAKVGGSLQSSYGEPKKSVMDRLELAKLPAKGSGPKKSGKPSTPGVLSRLGSKPGASAKPGGVSRKPGILDRLG